MMSARQLFFVVLLLFFFFQAEDGIRDRNVTGVQTCALPIYRKVFLVAPAIINLSINFVLHDQVFGKLLAHVIARSEERRVGKECKCGCGADYENKKAKDQTERHQARQESTETSQWERTTLGE